MNMDNLIPLLVGVVFFAAGAWMTYTSIHRKGHCTEETMATIVDYEEHETTDHDTLTVDVSFFPVYRYHVDGKEYESIGTVGSGRKKYDIGDEVLIVYNPADPKEFEEPGDNKKSLGGGILALVIGIGLLVYTFFIKH